MKILSDDFVIAKSIQTSWPSNGCGVEKLKAKHGAFLHRHTVLHEQAQIDFNREDTYWLVLSEVAKQEASYVAILSKAFVCEMHVLRSQRALAVVLRNGFQKI